jgi:hypothetical protein
LIRCVQAMIWENIQCIKISNSLYIIKKKIAVDTFLANGLTVSYK